MPGEVGPFVEPDLGFGLPPAWIDDGSFADAGLEPNQLTPTTVAPLGAAAPRELPELRLDPFAGIEERLDQLAADSATACTVADRDGDGLNDEAVKRRDARISAGIPLYDEPPAFPVMTAYHPDKMGEDPRLIEQRMMLRYLAMSVNPLIGMGATADHLFGGNGGFQGAGMALGILAEGKGGGPRRSSRLTSRSRQNAQLKAARARPYDSSTAKHSRNVEASKGPRGDTKVAARQRRKAEQTAHRETGRTSQAKRDAAKRRIEEGDAPEDAHGNARHGWETTPAQQLARAKHNIDPATGKPIVDKSGEPLPPPQYGASRFSDELSQAQALRQGDKALAKEIEARPGKDKFVLFVRSSNGAIGETYFADGTSAPSRVGVDRLM